MRTKEKPRNPEGLTHDQLQAKCWRWGWNTYPDVQYLFFAVLNEVKRLPCETDKEHLIRIGQAKALGLVPGVLDLLLLWQPIHAFDIKVGDDRISPAQKKFCEHLTAIGGHWHEIRLFTQFQEIFGNIVSNNYGLKGV